MAGQDQFKPYIPDDSKMPEFTPKAIIFGVIFGVIFGASNVYLALRAGLTVSASIPIAVLAISLLKRLGGSTILENNIVQTIGSAGESIASGVVFTLPGFLFLSPGAHGDQFFTYWTIFTLALLGGMLGVLMMIPLRRALIVEEHGNLPYPEGTACAAVLEAGEKGGQLAKLAYQGLGFALVYAALQQVFHVIAEVPGWVSDKASKILPAATVNGAITPEYMGVGYIIGPRIAGILVAGGVMAWLGLIPLIASIVPGDVIGSQLLKLGYIKEAIHPGIYQWQAATQTYVWLKDAAGVEFLQLNRAIYLAFVRQIGAGAVAAGGFITLIKTLPTIVSAFKGSIGSFGGAKAAGEVRRTERDLPISVVIIGSIILVGVMALLPFIPGGFGGKLLLGVMIVVFGFFFVTVSSRIVGIIGTSSNPVSGMTIATLMATCLIFLGLKWTGDFYQPMALAVGGMVCIAAANAGATSQDLKTGYLVGATPKYQQIGLMFGAIGAALVIGLTMKVLDNAHISAATGQMVHAIGSEKFPAPQGTLMATLIKGMLSHNLDWQFVLVGAFLSVTIELCGVNALSFAVGAYLPLSTTLPIWVGGVIKGVVDKRKGKAADSELGNGSLFATGLVAGGALGGVIVAMIVAGADKLSLGGNPWLLDLLHRMDVSHKLIQLKMLGEGGYQILGVAFFTLMGIVLYRIAMRPEVDIEH